MGEAFNHAVRLLGIFADFLDRVSPWGIPWPVMVACVFPIVTAVLAVLVWLSRGRAWRVRCEYTGTRNGVPCRRPVNGEWARCHQHRPGQHRSNAEPVDDRFRWQTKRNGLLVERDDIQGRGFVRARSQARTLLYHRGFARPPRDVRVYRRTWVSDRRDDFRKLRDQLQEAGGADFRAVFRGPAGLSARVAVNEQLAQVIQATRTALLLVVTGLVLVGIAIWRDHPNYSILNFAATFVFIAAWMVARWGIWGTASGEVASSGISWPRRSLLDTLRWFGEFMLISFLAGQLLTHLDKVVQGPGAL